MGVEAEFDLLKLEAGDSVLELAPAIGGGVASLDIGGHEILRRADWDALQRRSPLGLAEFPMAPWVNRVAGGRCLIDGEEIDVSSDPAADPLGLHGLAWRRPWAIAERCIDMALLKLDWPGGPMWPFPFEMTRRFVVGADRLTVEAVLRNTGDRRMPAALGFHPYFPSSGAVLRATVAGAWINAPDGIPQRWSAIADAARLTAGVAVRDLDLDHCFTGWDGQAMLGWPTHALIIDADPPTSFLQVYTPKDAGYFCIEPQTAMPDALNRTLGEGGLQMLAPLQSLTLRLQLRTSPGA